MIDSGYFDDFIQPWLKLCLRCILRFYLSLYIRCWVWQPVKLGGLYLHRVSEHFYLCSLFIPSYIWRVIDWFTVQQMLHSMSDVNWHQLVCFVENLIHLMNYSHLVANERVKEKKTLDSLSCYSICKTKQRGGVFTPYLFQKEGRRLKCDKSETSDFRTIWWLKRRLTYSWRIRWMDAMF